MIYYQGIFNVPANTPQETIRDEFIEVFGADGENSIPGFDIPEGGIMPSSVQAQGKHLVLCTFPYDYDTMDDKLSASGKNWQCWGFRSIHKVKPVYACSDEQYVDQESCELAGETWSQVGSEVDIIVSTNPSVLALLEKRWNRDENGNPTTERTPESNWITTYGELWS